MALAFTKSIPSTRALKIFEGEIDFASIAAAASAVMAEVSVSCPGVLSTDMAISFQAAESGLSFGIAGVRVSADDTIMVMVFTADDAAIDEGAMDFRLIVCPAI